MSEKTFNEHDVLINVVELASELATESLLRSWDYLSKGQIYIEDDGVLSYTEKAQEDFNYFYDKHYDLILSCKQKIMYRDITEVTAYIMYYDLLEFSVNGSFFSKIDIAIQLAKEFVAKYPLDDEWDDKDWEETIENFLKLKGITI